MRFLSRRALRFAVVFLVVRVLVDLATPLLPGAFRLNPEDSVEAATRSAHSGSSVVNSPGSTTPQRVPTSFASSALTVRQSTPAAPRELRGHTPRLTCFTELIASSPSPDDD